MYICQALVDGSLATLFVPLVLAWECLNEPSTLALRLGASSIGGGESLHAPGIDGTVVKPVLCDSCVLEFVAVRSRVFWCRAFARRDATPSEKEGTVVAC